MKQRIFAVLFFLFSMILFCGIVFRSSPYRLLRPYTLSSGEKLIKDSEYRLSEHGDHWQIRVNSKYGDFFIDQIPVTNSNYKKCLRSGACTPQHFAGLYTDYENEFLYGRFPAVFVTMGEAETYCEAYGGHLPTYYQWMTAAGADELYPWGEEDPSPVRVNSDGYYQGLTPSGWLPRGATPSGILDMAGNMREWVLALEYPYRLTMNHMEDTADYKVYLDEIRANPDWYILLKGGGAQGSSEEIQNFSFLSHYQYSAGVNRGFRCVYEVSEDSE